MSEEEIIKLIEELMCLYKEQMNCDKYYNEIIERSTRNFKALQGLLDLYNKEKEKKREVINYCKKDLAFKRRLERAKDTIDNYNIGRFDTSQSILDILEE